jgi:hypothetical protein
MISDDRFYLIGADGIKYPAAKVNGTFQVGKGREETPDELGLFASAVLKFRKGGRFLTPTGHKSIMGFGGRARKAVSYWLEPSIASAIGVPSFGTI